MSKYTLTGIQNFDTFNMEFERVDKAIAFLNKCESGSMITINEPANKLTGYLKDASGLSLILNTNEEACESDEDCEPETVSFRQPTNPFSFDAEITAPQKKIMATMSILKTSETIDPLVTRSYVDNLKKELAADIGSTVLADIRKKKRESLDHTELELATSDILASIRNRASIGLGKTASQKLKELYNRSSTKTTEPIGFDSLRSWSTSTEIRSGALSMGILA